MNETDVWYAIEASVKDADDWYTASAGTSDSIESAKGKLADLQRCDIKQRMSNLWEYRIVRKTVTTEVVG